MRPFVKIENNLLVLFVLVIGSMLAEAEGLRRDFFSQEEVRQWPPLLQGYGTQRGRVDVAFFSINSARLPHEARVRLKDLATILTAPDLRRFRFEIAGHTDATGPAAYNNRLSRQRAEAVRDYLLARGVDAKRLRVTQHGSRNLKDVSHPMAPINRRVEVINVGLTESTKKTPAITPSYAPITAPPAQALSTEHKETPESLESSNSESSTAENLNEKAVLLYHQGKYREAEPLFQQALAIAEQKYGRDQAGVWLALNNVAMNYKAQGQYTKAESLFKRALVIVEKAHGSEDPKVATSLNNLGSVYQDQGWYAEAEFLYKRSLFIVKKVFGSKDSSVGLALNNLGSVEQAQGKYAEAEALFQRALTLQEQALGFNHLDVALALNNLGSIYQVQGRYAEAEPLFKRALAIREKALKPDHPTVGLALNNLGSIYQAQGRYAEAEPLLKRALILRQKVLGPTHVDVGQSLNNLGSLYQDQGRYAEAEPLHQRALVILVKALGPDHPAVARVLNNLGLIYEDQARYIEAEPLLQNALTIQEKTLGVDHPEVASSLGDLAVLYGRQGRHAEALTYVRRASAALRRRLVAVPEQWSTQSKSEARIQQSIFQIHLDLITTRLQETLALQEALTAESFEIGQLFHERSLDATLAQLVALGGPLAERVQQQRILLMARRRAESEWFYATATPSTERHPELEQTLGERLHTLDQQINELSEPLKKDFPVYAELIRPEPIPLDQLQSWLHADEALLMFAIGKGKNGNQSYVWWVRSNGAGVRSLPMGQATLQPRIDGLVAALEGRIDPPPWRVTTTKVFPFDEVHTFYQEWIEPEVTHLEGIKTLFLVSDGALDRLPFTALVTELPPTGVSDRQRVGWLVQRWKPIILSTVGILRALRTEATVSIPQTQKSPQ